MWRLHALITTQPAAAGAGAGAPAAWSLPQQQQQQQQQGWEEPAGPREFSSQTARLAWRSRAQMQWLFDTHAAAPAAAATSLFAPPAAAAAAAKASSSSSKLAAAAAAQSAQLVLLGVDEQTNTPYFAVDVTDCADVPTAAAATAKPAPGSIGSNSDFAQGRGKGPLKLPALAAELQPSHSWVDVRSAALRVRPAEGALVAQARSLLYWHQHHRFCSACGAASLSEQGGYLRKCTSCGASHFPRTDPVVIMLVSNAAHTHVLLHRQAHFQPHTYSVLAGFVEPAETIEEAVARESWEETGVRVGSVRYHSSQPWPFPSSLMIGCWAEAKSTERLPEITFDTHEVTDAKWFSRDELHNMLRVAHDVALAQRTAARHPADKAAADTLAAANSSTALRIPPPIGIAHTLVKDWLAQTQPYQLKKT